MAIIEYLRRRRRKPEGREEKAGAKKAPAKTPGRRRTKETSRLPEEVKQAARRRRNLALAAQTQKTPEGGRGRSFTESGSERWKRPFGPFLFWLSLRTRTIRLTEPEDGDKMKMNFNIMNGGVLPVEATP